MKTFVEVNTEKYEKIEDAIEEYLNYIVFEKGLSDRTKKSYQNDLNIYKDFLNKRNKNTINIFAFFFKTRFLCINTSTY